ncbi:putative CMP/dCMP deaminase [Actinoplanes missouriensis 431]|uniref:Putative CMP/dCMP deaminase n=1 Tax=Actinoplanes missouriensis (strain ATCC 14538 / DSM 43046 / CBS 188.64 / JCM 3121 / NBRC 102363 / NCIMB 12654 / NRRL B-3342 / UNCC 431) TaxID=512565 RepID=I0GYA7_ACTM4|nr:deaminase [Actinoplanes missouriensis]BAL85744.1 putative CMP/dCMP deaminase [Actinoplanes missouriensis 431]
MDHHRWMSRAVDLAHRCPRSETAFAVEAVIVDASGREIASGFSRDDDPRVHAEESALLKAAGDARLREATIYSTLEPCSERASRPHATCTSLIIAAGIPRVVIAWREPDVFVHCEGVALLRAAGVEVLELPSFAAGAQEPNLHLGVLAARR